MDTSSTLSGTQSAGMQMRERRVRESSYHPMASDSDDGEISDGDPPFYAGGPSMMTSHAQAPLPPVSALPSPVHYSPRPPNSNNGTLVGTTGGAPNLSATNTSKKSTNKRSFEELEDIVFSNPRSFATLAFAIAESRGVILIVTDDRTHKVTSAYMHITCAFRKSGCPFILKLTKAKEGGWVLKGKAVDVKQRSVYRCRHPAGAVPEIPSATPQSSTSSTQASPYYSGSTSSHPMTTSVEGGVSKPKAAKPLTRQPASATGTNDSLEQHESSAGKVTRGPGRPRNPVPPTTSSGYAGTTPSGARMTPITTRPPPTSAADRALAPPFEPSPFERSQNLQAQIVPVLRGGQPTKGFSAPKGGGGDCDSNYHNSPRQRGRGSSYGYGNDGGDVHASDSILSTVPVIARSDPRALPDWTKLLRLLTPGDLSRSRSRSPSSSSGNDESPDPSSASSRAVPGPSSSRPMTLVPLAQVLSHPYMSVTPSLFFAPTTTVEMQREILEGLPVDKVGVWNKVWAKSVLTSAIARSTWSEITSNEFKSSTTYKMEQDDNDDVDDAADEDDDDDVENENEDRDVEEGGRVGLNGRTTRRKVKVVEAGRGDMFPTTGGNRWMKTRNREGFAVGFKAEDEWYLADPNLDRY